jgi:hypothetical protein
MVEEPERCNDLRITDCGLGNTRYIRLKKTIDRIINKTEDNLLASAAIHNNSTKDE